MRAGARTGAISRADAEGVARAYRFFWRLQCGARLLSDRPLDMAAIGEGGRAFLLRETGEAGLDALSARIGDQAAAAAEYRSVSRRGSGGGGRCGIRGDEQRWRAGGGLGRAASGRRRE